MNINYKKYILTLFATFLMLSCNDKFLERFPLDEISAETFWNTENDLKVYNNRIYDLAKSENLEFVCAEAKLDVSPLKWLKNSK